MYKFNSLAFLVWLCLSAFSIPLYSGAAPQSTDFKWNAVIGMSPAATDVDALLDANQVAARVKALGIAADIGSGRLALSGAQDLEQLRAALFDEVAESADFLGGPVEMTLSLPAGNQPVRLDLESRPGTGYVWTVLPSAQSRYAQVGASTFAMRYAGPGAPAIQTIDLESRALGDGVVRLVYRRLFEPDEPIHSSLTLQVASTSGVIEISDPTPSQPMASDEGPSTPRPTAALPIRTALPSAYDARTLGIITPVRDQRSCGSCWAFGTVGVMETAVSLGAGLATDLSEQFLVSCNRDGWSCGGGLTASKYHVAFAGIGQSGAGAVLESKKPYTATKGSCPSDYEKAFIGSAWQFLTGSEWTMPTNDQIKNAIMTYGAVTAGVCADDGWYDYTSGVYASSYNDCGGSTNHQIVLVGWDDATQSWILRNSWGAGWGEAGYMRIKYDPAGTTSRVGEGGSWIKVDLGYALTVNASGATAVAITATPTTYAGTTRYVKKGIPSGTAITLTAPATKGSVGFASWTGCDSTSGTACSVSMTGNRTVTAKYTPVTTYTLTVDSAGARAVGITATPTTYAGTTRYVRRGIASGTAITLTAPATKGRLSFTDWTGCDSASSADCSVSMTSNRTVTANYAK